VRTKHLFLLALVVGVLLLVAACGGTSDTAEPPGEQEQAGQEEQVGEEGAATEEETQTEQATEGQEATEEEQAADTSEAAGEEGVALISSADYADGCASCHVKTDDHDYTLAAEIANIEGHPGVPAETVADCMGCHAEGPIAFKALLHRVHLEGQYYVKRWGSACVTCHAVSVEGEAFVKGLQEGEVEVLDIAVGSEDTAPDGCNSCHVKKGENDYTLTAELKNIEGHPPVATEDVNVCAGCHTEGELALNRVLHVAHLQGTHYMEYFQGSCANCHALTEDGTISVKGLE